MKIYFEDGVLTATQQLKIGARYLVNASVGYSQNRAILDRIKEEDPNASVYTNSLAALSNFYCWNNELKLPELYLKSSKTGEFVRVDIIHGGAPRAGQNLLLMYLSGAIRD